MTTVTGSSGSTNFAAGLAESESGLVTLLADRVRRQFLYLNDFLTLVSEIVARTLTQPALLSLVTQIAESMSETLAWHRYLDRFDASLARRARTIQSMLGQAKAGLGVPSTWVDEDGGELCLAWRSGPKYIELQLNRERPTMTWIYRDTVANERERNLEDHEVLDPRFCELFGTLLR